jgi:hypothetical protein
MGRIRFSSSISIFAALQPMPEFGPHLLLGFTVPDVRVIIFQADQFPGVKILDPCLREYMGGVCDEDIAPMHAPSCTS